MTRRTRASARSRTRTRPSAASRTALSTAASAWIMRDVINGIFIDRRAAMVLPIGLAVFAIFIAKGVATYGQTVILSRIGANIVASIQKRIADHVLAQGVASCTLGAAPARVRQSLAHDRPGTPCWCLGGASTGGLAAAGCLSELCPH